MICGSCGTSNPAGMRFCGMCGSRLEPQVTGRERRRVSVVFIDLAAFTTLTRGFDPEDLRDLADEVLTIVAGVIEDYDGHVDAFRGDGLIALFGAPHSHPDDPQRAVLAAAAGLQAIESIGESKGYPLRGRAGVNTGIVIAGSVGSGRVRDYTVMGSTVNLAARLESAAEPGEVWVGPETFEATRHILLYEQTLPVHLAGFPNIHHAYRLMSSLDQHEVDPYGTLGFIGRKRELAALESAFERVVKQGKARELWLVGEAGSGKTRLLREFLAGLGERTTRVFWVEGKPSESYSWESLAREIFGLQDGEEPRLRQQKVITLLREIMPSETRWHRLIMASLELAEQKPWTRLERRAMDRTNIAWRDLIVALTRHAERPGPVVLSVENNPQDLALQQFMTLLTEADAPILTVRTSRGRHLPEGADTIHLSPLNLDESLELLNQLASPILKVATQSLVYQVGGVPAYILELGRALSITQGGSFSGSLASLLQARLDMLPLETRQLLAYAAVAGERCWEGLATQLSSTSGTREIGQLIRENLLIQEATSSIPGEVEFRFQSELLRHAVLRMIPFSDRPILHLKVGSWLEQHAPLALSELIGYHFQQGGADEAAYAHYLSAADQASASETIEKAVELFERLLKLEVGPELLAQGALAFAQGAFGWDDMSLALRQLEAAERWIADCDEEAGAKLEASYQRLRSELADHAIEAKTS